MSKAEELLAQPSTAPPVELDDKCLGHLVFKPLTSQKQECPPERRVLHLYKTPITLGRVGCDITLDSKIRELMVSRKHATFTLKTLADSRKVITILDSSTNGTHINGDRIKAECELREGDVLQFGSVQSDCVYTFLEGTPLKLAPVSDHAEESANGSSHITPSLSVAPPSVPESSAAPSATSASSNTSKNNGIASPSSSHGISSAASSVVVHPSDWNSVDIQQWLERVVPDVFHDHKQEFIDEVATVDILVSLNEDEMEQELHITKANQRRKLQKAIAELKSKFAISSNNNFGVIPSSLNRTVAYSTSNIAEDNESEDNGVEDASNEASYEGDEQEVGDKIEQKTTWPNIQENAHLHSNRHRSDNIHSGVDNSSANNNNTHGKRKAEEVTYVLDDYGKAKVPKAHKFGIGEKIEAKCQKIGAGERQAWFDAHIISHKQLNGANAYVVRYAGYEDKYNETLPESCIRPNSNGDWDWKSLRVGDEVLAKSSNGWWYDAIVVSKLVDPHIKGNKAKKCLRVHFTDILVPDRDLKYGDVFLPVV